jgi:hypothetical protein
MRTGELAYEFRSDEGHSKKRNSYLSSILFGRMMRMEGLLTYGVPYWKAYLRDGKDPRNRLISAPTPPLADKDIRSSHFWL